MKEIIKNVPNHYKWVVLILTLLSVSLIIGSFFVPPIGVIDGSVLAAVGEVFAFSSLWVAVGAIERGYDATIKKGELEVKLSDDEK